jgi:LPS export ABC transporter protein LptC
MKLSIRVLYYLVMIGFLLSACSKESGEDITFVKGRVPDEVFTDFVTQESDSGLVRWRLTAPKANRFNDENLVVLDKPKIEFYDDSGKLQTTLTSESGEYFENKSDMLAYGAVVVQSVDGDVLETDSLLWMNNEERIISNSFVKLTRGKDVVTGYGLECDQSLSSVDIKRNVKATIINEKGAIEE